MPRVVHFEVHASDPERAIAFYSGLFGWKFEKAPGPAEYWSIVTGPADEEGINGGLIRRRGEIDGQAVLAYVCSINVGSAAESEERVVALGGQIVVPTMTIQGYGRQFFARDPEGNIFGVTERDAHET